jgi:MoaA/NifB/PqqE/SkfB family radical SAM enzyme
MDLQADVAYVTSPYVSYGQGTLDDLLRPARHEGVQPCELEALDWFREPRPLQTVNGRYPAPLLLELASRRWILPASTVWQTHNVTALEIEVTTHCNWRCQFCPVSLAPKRARAMPMALYEEILQKAVDLGTVTSVSVNSYNEPTLDRHFDERAKMLASFGLKLILHTNGTALDEGRLRRLRDLEVLDYLCFNLPSIEPSEFTRLTRASPKIHGRVLASIETALSLGLPVHFSVNGTPLEQAANLPAIQRAYGDRSSEPLNGWETSDRCGLLRNRYYLGINVQGTLAGCSNVLNWLFVSVDGNCFICCEDYHQKEIFGNIGNGSLQEILSSSAAQELRKKVFGAVPSCSDFLCRHCSLMKDRTDRLRQLSHTTPSASRVMESNP